MDDINSIDLVFDADSPFLVMPDVVRCKSDLPTNRHKAWHIGRVGADAYMSLPNDPPAPVARDDGMVLARADLRTSAAKAHYIGQHGESAWLELPAVRPSE